MQIDSAQTATTVGFSCPTYNMMSGALGRLQTNSRTALKDNFRCKLEDPRIEGSLRLPKSRRGRQLLVWESPGYTVEGGANVVEIRAIENIEPLRDQLQPSVFPEPELSRDPWIQT